MRQPAILVCCAVMLSAPLAAQQRPAQRPNQPRQTPAQPAAAPAPAPQRAPAVPTAAASTQASVAVIVPGRMISGQWFPPAGGVAGPARIQIDYGQPHIRGRALGDVVPMDSIWRVGANLATHLTTDVDLTIGGAFIPRGVYTLYALPSRSGWKLVVNRQTRQWGTEYDASQDLARVDLRARTLSEPIESFSIWLVPTLPPRPAQGATAPPPVPASGTLRLAWGTTELSADWRIGR